MSERFVSTSALLSETVELGHFVVINDGVRIGNNVLIGNNVVIHEGTIIGDNVDIADGAVLGKKPQLSKNSTAKRDGKLPPLRVGDQCRIGASSILYAGVTIGKGTVIADLSSVRERCNLGDYVVIGRGVSVENDTNIGSYTKIQTGAYITAYMNIGEYVFIAPMVQTTNDNYMGRTLERFKYIKGPTIKRGARIGVGAILLPGITVEEETFIAAGTLVAKDTEKETLYMGTPAQPIRKVRKEELVDNQ